MANVVTSKVRELTSKLATQFGQLNAQRKEKEKEEKKLSPKIKALMADSDEGAVKTKSVSETTGEDVTAYTFAPEDSPYQLVYTQYKMADVSWKDEFEKLYEKHNGKGSFKKFVTNLDTKDADKLEVKPNPNYKP